MSCIPWPPRSLQVYKLWLCAHLFFYTKYPILRPSLVLIIAEVFHMFSWNFCYSGTKKWFRKRSPETYWCHFKSLFRQITTLWNNKGLYAVICRANHFINSNSLSDALSIRHFSLNQIKKKRQYWAWDFSLKVSDRSHFHLRWLKGNTGVACKKSFQLTHCYTKSLHM